MERLIFAIFSIAIFTSFSFTSSTLSSEESEPQVCEGFVPENDQYYPVPEPDAFGRYGRITGLTSHQFHQVLDRAEEAYAPFLEKQGIKLEINRLWNDGTVNASADQRKRGVYAVNMFGGLARHPVMTPDGFLMVVCHELGHHLAGAPTYGGFGNAWASAEGQADYFASMKCFRELYTEQEHLDWYKQATIDDVAFRACQAVYSDTIEHTACLRASQAGMVLARFFSHLRKGPDPSFETPLSSEVRRTQVNHPHAQCRLDTYFQGALCPMYSDLPFGAENPFEGACNAYQGFEYGTRPTCWFSNDQFSRYLPGGEQQRPWWWWIVWWMYT